MKVTAHQGFIRASVLVAVVAVMAAIGLFVLFGPPHLLAKTETPLYCASCHVMESQYEAWFHVGAHRSIKCVDCHLPHQNKGLYYTWKTIDGFNDMLVFYSGSAPENIRLSGHGQSVVQDNCIRCHETAVAMIDQSRQCWDCHRFLKHSQAGIRSGI